MQGTQEVVKRKISKSQEAALGAQISVELDFPFQD